MRQVHRAPVGSHVQFSEETQSPLGIYMLGVGWGSIKAQFIDWLSVWECGPGPVHLTPCGMVSTCGLGAGPAELKQSFQLSSGS